MLLLLISKNPVGAWKNLVRHSTLNLVLALELRELSNTQLSFLFKEQNLQGQGYNSVGESSKSPGFHLKHCGCLFVCVSVFNSSLKRRVVPRWCLYCRLQGLSCISSTSAGESCDRPWNSWGVVLGSSGTKFPKTDSLYTSWIDTGAVIGPFV